MATKNGNLARTRQQIANRLKLGRKARSRVTDSVCGPTDKITTYSELEKEGRKVKRIGEISGVGTF